jgi:hypothetical protein
VTVATVHVAANAAVNAIVAQIKIANVPQKKIAAKTKNVAQKKNSVPKKNIAQIAVKVKNAYASLRMDAV